MAVRAVVTTEPSLPVTVTLGATVRPVGSVTFTRRTTSSTLVKSTLFSPVVIVPVISFSVGAVWV